MVRARMEEVHVTKEAAASLCKNHRSLNEDIEGFRTPPWPVPRAKNSMDTIGAAFQSSMLCVLLGLAAIGLVGHSTGHQLGPLQ
jgi:hypothetical protein